MDSKEFDKLIREKLNGYSMEPEEDLWSSVASSLDKKERVISPFVKRALVASLSIAASLLLLLYLNKDNSVSPVLSPSLSSLQQESTLASAELSEPIEKESTHSTVVGARRGVKQKKGTEITVVESASATELLAKSELLESNDNFTEQELVDEKEPALDLSAKEATKVTKGSYPKLEEYKRGSKRTGSLSFGTNISPSTSNSSVSLMAVSRAQGGYLPSNVVSTILKAHVPQEVVSNTKFFMPISVGFQFLYPLNNSFSIGSGLSYSILFSEYDDISREERRETKQTLHYIGLPLNIYYSFFQKNNLSLYSYGGAMFEKGLYAYYNIVERGTKKEEGEFIDGLQWSVGAGVGADLKIGKITSLYFDPSFAYYFDCSQPISIRTAQPLQFKFELGLRVRL